MEPNFDKSPDGLLPCVTQHRLTGEVLTLAYMNRLAFAKTLETGEVHYWSRSRDALWRKGETSGHVQRLHGLKLDCDQDAILAIVDPAGPACHTGRRTCFHNHPDGQDASADVLLPELVALLQARHAGDADAGSYTAKLFADENKRLKKLAEEAGEVIMAVKDLHTGKGTLDDLAGEFADLLFHNLVVAQAVGVTPQHILQTLADRRGQRRHE